MTRPEVNAALAARWFQGLLLEEEVFQRFMPVDMLAADADTGGQRHADGVGEFHHVSSNRREVGQGSEPFRCMSGSVDCREAAC